MKRLGILLLITGIIITYFIGFRPAKASEELETESLDNEVNLILPWPTGGMTDKVARGFAPIFEKHLGRTVVVVNKEGASGAMGTEYVYDQPSDGNTILLSSETPALFNIMNISKRNFSDFYCLTMLTHDFNVLVVPENSKYGNLEELINDIKINPKSIKMSYSGPGAGAHILGLLFRNLGLDIALIPSGEENLAMIELIKGEADFTFMNYGTVKKYIESGDLKTLATFTDKEIDGLKGVPSIIDEVPEIEEYTLLYFPNSLLIREDTPEEIKTDLKIAVEETLKDPEWQKFINTMSYTRLDHMTTEDIEEYWNKYASITSWILYDGNAVKISPEEFGINRYKK